MMRTKMHPRRVGRDNGRTTYASRRAMRARPFARAAFAIWGLMSDIIGAALVVFGLFACALIATGACLVLFF
jgi:hypothetical protein